MGVFKEWIIDYQWHFFTEEAQVFGFESYLRIVTVNVMRSVVCSELRVLILQQNYFRTIAD